MLCARSLSILALAFSTVAFAPASAQAQDAVTPQVGIRAFASTGRKAKAAAAKIESAFAAAWKAEREGDKFLGGRAPKYQTKDSRRAKAAAADAQKNNLTHIIDATISKRRSTATIKLLLVDAKGNVLGTEKVTTRKVTQKAFESAVKALAALIPEPPPPPPDPVKEEEPVVEAAPAAAAASAEVPQDPAPAPASEAESGGGGGFGSVLAGTGLFFLGSGVTALAAGGAFTAGAVLGRDWENKATLNSGLREEVNTAIFWTSVGADAVLVAGVLTTLVGVALLTTGLLIE